MAELLIAACPAAGHVGPLLTVANRLVERGDRVTVLTSARYATRVREAGACAAALPAEADYDETRFDLDLPGRTDTSGVKRVNFDVINVFIKPMPHQTAALTQLFTQHTYDAVIADSHFLGVLPFLLGDRAARPPVLTYTPAPLMVTSRDTAPGGMGIAPMPGPLGRLRNRGLNMLAQHILLRPAHTYANSVLDRMNCPKLPVPLADWTVLADRMIVPTIEQFDYLRSDLPANVRYVGAVEPPPTRHFQHPPWWPILDQDRPVVHVTQGTIDNADLTRLLEPTIAALANEDVTVVATTGGRNLAALSAPLPSNTYIAEYLPHDWLLPKTDVLVTNGGHGAVQRALTRGVPLVVAGSTEDKPEVAARVAWSGSGINLRTGTPTPQAIRHAVRQVLHDGRYRQRAAELQWAYTQHDPITAIANLVDESVYERRAATR
jgi:MGT family glycosyltransferase